MKNQCKRCLHRKENNTCEFNFKNPNEKEKHEIEISWLAEHHFYYLIKKYLPQIFTSIVLLVKNNEDKKKVIENLLITEGFKLILEINQNVTNDCPKYKFSWRRFFRCTK